jgi:putative oxidoreductase
MGSFLRSLTMLIGRLLIATIFILAGASKFLDYDQTSAYMASKGMTMIPLFLVGAAAFEIIGGLSLLVGYKTRIGAALLLIFLIPTTIIFHSFWNTSGAEHAQAQIDFLKNLAIFGGLLYVLNFGAGPLSIDACNCKRAPTNKPAS